MVARDINISFSDFGLIKAIYWDIEHSFSRIDLFLQSVPNFVSTQWSSFRAKTQKSNSFEARRQVPVRNKRSTELRKLNSQEINLVMCRLGVGSTSEDTGKSANNEHLDEDGLLSIFDIEEPSFDEIKETFGVFDSDKDGYIDCSDLRRVLCGLGFEQGCELEDCKRMIHDFDLNGDGLIDFHEFVIFMEKMLLA